MLTLILSIILYIAIVFYSARDIRIIAALFGWIPAIVIAQGITFLITYASYQR